MTTLLIISSILCGVLGRMGGSGNYPRQARVIGIPAILCILALIFGCHSWLLLLSFGLLVASVSTYWDFLFGYDEHFFHGFMIGLSFAPIAYATGHWLQFIPALTLSTLWMGFWSKLWNWDIAEEFGRYAILPFCVWLLFI